ncbi:hypothetical protein [Ruegeria arenilitoris]|uniref:hypothetical protein n=1 Tax=Ruegeria arenilitoris TaxID=1173585 RepID=UPI00147F1FCB|nr:hypothetical protein [Ruegeria arenilitoris]
MRYLFVIIPAFLTGCDAVRQSLDRAPDAEPAQTTETAAALEEVEATPVAAVNTGWAGAKTTIAGLGDPNKPGRWLETPLVETEINGRVVVPKTGAQAYITLVPAPSGGSRLSVEAMRALLVPFDELVELDVYSN